MGGWHNTARRRRGRRAGRGERLGLTRDCPTHFVAGDSDRGLVTSAVRRARARARARRFAGCRGDRAVAMVARIIRVTSAGELHEKLLQLVHPENLPSYLGGSCQCTECRTGQLQGGSMQAWEDVF